MKKTTRKLMSLLMVFAIVCSMIPAALAYDSVTLATGDTDTLFAEDIYDAINGDGYLGSLISNYISWDSSDSSVVSVDGDGYIADITAVSSGSATITASISSQVGLAASQSWTVRVYGSSSSGNVSDGTYVSVASAPSSLAVGESKSARIELDYPQYDYIESVTWSSSDRSVATVSTGSTNSAYSTATVTGVANGTATIYALVRYYESGEKAVIPEYVSFDVTVGAGSSTNTSDLYIDYDSLAVATDDYIDLTARTDDSTLAYYLDLSDVVWTSDDASVASFSSSISDSSDSGSSARVYGRSAGQAVITATLVYNGVTYTDSVIVTVGTDLSVEATVSTNETDFTLDSTNAKTTVSVVEQIADAIYYENWYTDYVLDHVVFSNVTSSCGSLSATAGYSYYYGYSSYYRDLANVTFTPTKAGTATFAFTAYDDDNPANSYDGVLTITVEQGAPTMDILYSLTKGQSKALDVADFEEFWDESYGSYYYSLDHIKFGTITGNVGSLVYTNTSNREVQVGTSTKFYVSPTGSSQYGIDEISFEPAKTGSTYRTGTLTVPFTAYGTRYNSSSATSYSGTMYIVVTDGEVADIEYECTASGLDLVPSDFVSVYKSALDVTTSNPTVYIQFLDTPDSGSLYYNYTSGYNYGTKLTASNIDTLRFTSRTTGTYGIDDVTYIPGTGRNADTVRYVAYSAATGGTPLYVGEITFIQGEPTAIKYYGALNQAFTFDSDDFDATEEMFYASYITFGAPSSGTLYRDYANGTLATSGTTFTLSSTGSYGLPSVEDITYVPAVNFSGVVEIPFTASSLYNTEASGVIKIYIAKKLPDVPASHWAYNYITQLTAEGIVDGNPDGTFAPTRTLTYGEALKLIMEAAGYSESVATSGHWASNYLSRAYRLGLVSSASINLDSTITRNEVAAISAKALGLSKAYSITGSVKPVDSSDGYVYALYNAGILTGTNISGKNYFNGSNLLTRAEVCAIICRISEYDK